MLPAPTLLVPTYRGFSPSEALLSSPSMWESPFRAGVEVSKAEGLGLAAAQLCQADTEIGKRMEELHLRPQQGQVGQGRGRDCVVDVEAVG